MLRLGENRQKDDVSFLCREKNFRSYSLRLHGCLDFIGQQKDEEEDGGELEISKTFREAGAFLAWLKSPT